MIQTKLTVLLYVGVWKALRTVFLFWFFPQHLDFWFSVCLKFLLQPCVQLCDALQLKWQSWNTGCSLEATWWGKITWVIPSNLNASNRSQFVSWVSLPNMTNLKAYWHKRTPTLFRMESIAKLILLQSSQRSTLFQAGTA